MNAEEVRRGYLYFDDRGPYWVGVHPLTFGRARLQIGRGFSVEEEW